MEQKKKIQHKRPVRHHQIYWYMQSKSLSGRGETDRVCEDTIAENFPNVMKTLFYTRRYVMNSKKYE